MPWSRAAKSRLDLLGEGGETRRHSGGSLALDEHGEVPDEPRNVEGGTAGAERSSH